jgi:uncharacterized protein (TIGR00730 family)
MTLTQDQAGGGPLHQPPPQRPAVVRPDDPAVLQTLDRLLADVGAEPDAFGTRLVRDLLVTGLKLIPDGRHTGELKLITNSVRELRHAFRVFARYAAPHKVTIFGSARTPEDHPDYRAAVEFSRLMAEAGWMVITGAGMGIMHAGHVGPGRESSFGVAIRLPFETNANQVIAGDEKLIHFRYFFTRKLMFISQAEAVALFPGGFGTLDEAFEALTLVQTGKAAMMPIVMVEGSGPGAGYWRAFDEFVRGQLLARGFISPEDLSLYRLCPTPRDAADHIIHFYRVFHSLRYVRDDLVIRLQRPVSEALVRSLDEEFRDLVKSGSIRLRGPYAEEDELLDLPRLAFTHTKARYGRVRQLIDRLNAEG